MVWTGRPLPCYNNSTYRHAEMTLYALYIAYFSDFLLVILQLICLVSFCIFPCCLTISERKQSKSITLFHLYQSAASCQCSSQLHIQAATVWKYVKFLSALSSADLWLRGCVVSHIGSRWRWMVSFTLRPLYPQPKLCMVLGCSEEETSRPEWNMDCSVVQSLPDNYINLLHSSEDFGPKFTFWKFSWFKNCSWSTQILLFFFIQSSFTSNFLASMQ